MRAVRGDLNAFKLWFRSRLERLGGLQIMYVHRVTSLQVVLALDFWSLETCGKMFVVLGSRYLFQEESTSRLNVGKPLFTM